MKVKRANKIKIGKKYGHDGMEGIAELSYDVYGNKTILVKSGTDGFFPLDVLKWNGELTSKPV